MGVAEGQLASRQKKVQQLNSIVRELLGKFAQQYADSWFRDMAKVCERWQRCSPPTLTRALPARCCPAARARRRSWSCCCRTQ